MNSIIHQLAEQMSFGKLSSPRAFYGLEELTLLLEATLIQKTNTEHALQLYVAYSMGVVFGPRAGSLTQNRDYPDQYLRWRDITFEINDRKLMITISLQWVKGFRDVYQESYESQLIDAYLPEINGLSTHQYPRYISEWTDLDV